MGKNGDVCNTAITEAIFDLEALLDSNDWEGLQGIVLISKILYDIVSNAFPYFTESFQLCSTFDGTLPEDVANFMQSLVGTLQGAVQYDFNGPINVDKVCSIMENEDLGTPLQRFQELNR